MEAEQAAKAPTPKLALSIEEAADATSLSVARMYALVAEGQIVARKIGRRTLILPGDLDKWLAELPVRTVRKARREAR